MKNYWKQFVAWATVLRANPLTSSRAWLMVMYSIIAIVSMALFSVLFGMERREVIEQHATELHESSHATEALLGRLITTERRIQALFVLLVPFIAYYLAELTSRPLKDLIASQRRFIANASHELRTPLAIMKASSEIALMQKERLTLDEAVAALESNQEEIDRMSARIKILLRIMNIDSNLGEIAHSKVDLVYLVNRVSNITIKKFPAAQKLQLGVDVPKAAFVRGNSIALEELIVNLMRNAIKYTPPGGSIGISVKQYPSQVWLRVEDTGIGIPRQELSRIFEPFYRTQEAKAYSSGGSGLGLALVKEIVKQHHARISVQSTVGKGTAFTVIFPASI